MVQLLQLVYSLFPEVLFLLLEPLHLVQCILKVLSGFLLLLVHSAGYEIALVDSVGVDALCIELGKPPLFTFHLFSHHSLVIFVEFDPNFVNSEKLCDQVLKH